MGGREVGGLANMLTAHMELDNPEHRRIVQSFWGSPKIADRPGLKAIDMFRAVEDGRIKALWIMGTNPVDSMPDADRVRAALSACPFVVVSDVIARTDTTEFADVLLPALAWGEKEGTVTNSERRVSRQRAFLPAPFEARADWRQWAQIAQRMGFPGFDYRSARDIFAEYCALTAMENDGSRDLDMGQHAGISHEAYAGLAPFSWPAPKGEPPRERRFFADGRFYHPDGRARFIATPIRAPASACDARYPLALNTGRIRDHWHTMTRTAKTPCLTAHIGEPFVEIHPDDARGLGVRAADLVTVRSPRGEAVLRAVVTPRQRRGSLFAPMHWTGQYASAGRIDALIGPATDPVSEPTADYWALAPLASGWQIELAGLAEPADWPGIARRTLACGDDVEWLAYNDSDTGRRAFAAFHGERLVGAVFFAREPVAVERSFVAGQLGKTLSPQDRLRLLSGRPGPEARNRGAAICACFDIGRNEILEAIREGCSSVASVGQRLKAGTNCGSCRAEIARLVEGAKKASVVA
jgi:assimilatory nitrate reductase catalytic subunit